LGHVLILKVLHRDQKTSVIAGVGSAFANTAFVGLPLARAVYGEHGVIIVTILISIHMPLMMTAATLLMERAQRLTGNATRTSPLTLASEIARNLATNPIVIALIVAAMLRLGGLHLPALLNNQVSTLADISGPLALISIGIGLSDRGLSGDVAPAVVVTAIKLLVMPALVLIACLLAGLDAASTGPLVLLAGVPAGVNVHLVALQFRAGQSLGSGIVLLTTLASALTSAAWLTFLPRA
jgi:predicted permease